jgi:hypothetical protein
LSESAFGRACLAAVWEHRFSKCRAREPPFKGLRINRTYRLASLEARQRVHIAFEVVDLAVKPVELTTVVPNTIALSFGVSCAARTAKAIHQPIAPRIEGGPKPHDRSGRNLERPEKRDERDPVLSGGGAGAGLCSSAAVCRFPPCPLQTRNIQCPSEGLEGYCILVQVILETKCPAQLYSEQFGFGDETQLMRTEDQAFPAAIPNDEKLVAWFECPA